MLVVYIIKISRETGLLVKSTQIPDEPKNHYSGMTKPTCLDRISLISSKKGADIRGLKNYRCAIIIITDQTLPNLSLVGPSVVFS